MAGKSHNLRGSGEPNVPGTMRALGGMKPGDRIVPGQPRIQLSMNYRERPNPEREWKREARERVKSETLMAGYRDFRNACALVAVLTETRDHIRAEGRNVPHGIRRKLKRAMADVERLRKYA